MKKNGNGNLQQYSGEYATEYHTNVKSILSKILSKIVQKSQLYVTDQETKFKSSNYCFKVPQQQRLGAGHKLRGGRGGATKWENHGF